MALVFCLGLNYVRIENMEVGILKSAFYYETAIGRMCIVQENECITNIDLDEMPRDAVCEETLLLKNAGNQLTEYFLAQRSSFDLPLAPKGTAFQKSVWQALVEIPYGATRCYSEIAKIIGNERACRAVGMANNKNPILIVIPCHRVIGKDGSLTGYGEGLPIKQRLLDLEKKGCEKEEL